MAPTVTRERPTFADGGAVAAGQAQRSFRPEPGGGSLEDAILRVWDDLSRDGSAPCPVCGGQIVLGDGCQSCGSELS